MTSLEELYSSYMDDDTPVLIEKSQPPVADWSQQLAWSKADMQAMGVANENIRDDVAIASARLIGRASVLGSSGSRMITFATETGGEYFIRMKRRAVLGRVAVQQPAGSVTSVAARPFLQVDGKALTVCYRGLATPPTKAGAHMFLYDQLQVGGYPCLTWPLGKERHTDGYRIPRAIESMQTVSTMPDWVEDVLHPM